MQTPHHSQTVLTTLAHVVSHQPLSSVGATPPRRRKADVGVFIVGDIVLVPGLGVQARQSFHASSASRAVPR